MSELFNPPNPEVRGYSALNQGAVEAKKWISRGFDLALAFFWASLLFNSFEMSPSLVPKTIVGALLLSVGPLLIGRWWTRATPGEWAWGLKREGGKLIQKEIRPFTFECLSAMITLFLTLGSFTWFYTSVISSPLIARARLIELESPSSDRKEESWHTIPYFFSLGAWPIQYAGAPIFYDLPYEVGPPKKLLGKVVARWSMPDIKVTLQGPLTPESTREISMAQECYQNPMSRPMDCLRFRSLTLARHLKGMKESGTPAKTIQWFEAPGSKAFENERPRGILLVGKGDRQGQSRFILINSKGAHSAIVLDYPLTQSGENAQALLAKIISGLQVFSDLGEGRLSIDQTLRGISLQEMSKATPNSALPLKLARIHSTLISAITVDPKNYEAWYHLGGTASLLIKFARQTQNTQLSAVAKPLLTSAARYARDVRPDEPRNEILDSLVIEAAKQ